MCKLLIVFGGTVFHCRATFCSTRWQSAEPGNQPENKLKFLVVFRSLHKWLASIMLIKKIIIATDPIQSLSSDSGLFSIAVLYRDRTKYSRTSPVLFRNIVRHCWYIHRVKICFLGKMSLNVGVVVLGFTLRGSS